MKQTYHTFVALRYLKSRKKRRSVSFNTVISILGVALGVMALLVVLSVMSGFHEDLQKKILGVNAHIVIQSHDGGILNHELLMEKIKTVEGVKAVSPFLMGQVMLSHNKRAHGVYIRGVDTKYEKFTTDIHNHMYSGMFDDLDNTADFPGIILGRDLASNLGVILEDTVNVISPFGEVGPFGMIPRMKKFRIVGIFEMGMYEYDANLAISALKPVQEFLRYPDQVNAFELRLDDIYAASGIKKVLQTLLGNQFYARDWMEMNRNLFAALKLEKLAMFIILTLIVLVAAFNIVSTLIMNVIEKEREIAILKAMGSTRGGIMSIFMIQGLLIGCIGTLIGLIGGYVVSYLINSYELIKLPSDVYYLSHLPVKMKLSDFIAVCSSALMISFIATIYPAHQASKLDPVEALRYE